MIAVSIQWKNDKGLWHVAALYDSFDFWYAKTQATMMLLNAVEHTKRYPNWEGAYQFVGTIRDVTLNMINERGECERQFIYKFLNEHKA